MTDQNPPWLTPALETCRQMLAQDRFPHGVLLVGPEGVGKLRLAGQLAALLLCQDQAIAKRPCGQCQGCVLLNAGNHPDFYKVQPPEDKRSIGVDQIRSLAGELNLTAALGGSRVAIINPADLMTHAAANSLLKTLEEPSGGTLLILPAARPSRLPATIRSRCQVIQQPRPKTEQALQWLNEQDPKASWASLLRLAGGAPLAALDMQAEGLDKLDQELARDLLEVRAGRATPMAVAERWKKKGGQRCLDWLHSSLVNLARARADAGELPRDLQKAGENINLDRLLAYIDRLARARVLLEGPANEPLILESVLIPWTRDLEPNRQQAVTQ